MVQKQQSSQLKFVSFPFYNVGYLFSLFEDNIDILNLFQFTYVNTVAELMIDNWANGRITIWMVIKLM
jgi:hypothetical protein